MKRLLALLTAIVLMLCTLPVFGLSVYADTEASTPIIDSGECGESLTWEFNQAEETLTISGSGDMQTYAYISYIPWYKYKFEIKNIVLPQGLSSICNYAFYKCKSVTSVAIPEGVTSIGSHVFYNCTTLTEVNIPESVTSIGSYAFWGCSSLVSVDIPDSVAVIDNYTFYECTSLTQVYMPANIASIGNYAFYHCIGLKAIDLSDNITSIGDYAFCGCSGFTSVDIPDSMTGISSYVFYGCTDLETVDIPVSIRSVGEHAFYGCEKLKGIYNRSLLKITAGSTSYGYIAYYADEVKWLITDSGTGGESISWEFNGETDTLTFTGFGNMTDYTYYDAYYANIPWYKYRNQIKHIVLPEGITSIGNRAFYNLTSLVSVDIPQSVTIIGNNAFYNCIGLTSIEISENVVKIDYDAFKRCSGLELLTVHGDNQYYFSKDNCLINIANKELVHGCKNCIIPDDGSVISIGNKAFSGCIGLTSITIPDSIVSIGSYVFEDCLNLLSVTVGEGVTSIGNYAFNYCRNLKTVYNYSDLAITAGSDTYGGVALYADNVYKLPCLTHVGGVGSCTERAVCVNCGEEYSDALGHTPVESGNYDSTCEATGWENRTACRLCGEILTEGNVVDVKAHTYKTTTTKATLSKNGSIVTKCSVCSTQKSSSVIYKISSVALSATSYTYNGKVKKPAVTVKNSKGTKLVKGTDYTVSYAGSRKNVGKYKVTVTFKGNYSGSKTLYFTVNPTKTAVKKLTPATKALKVSITKKSAQVSGYQIQYSTAKSFSGAKALKVTGTFKTIKSLKAKKTYYVRVRTYKKVGSKVYYSAWSAAKKAKTK